jgi:hypothetical protein
VKKKGEIEAPEVLKIPCTLFKVATLPLGGHRLSFDVPEVSANAVKELIGLENKQNFVMCLIKVDEENESKCAPSKKHLTLRK